MSVSIVDGIPKFYMQYNTNIVAKAMAVNREVRIALFASRIYLL